MEDMQLSYKNINNTMKLSKYIARALDSVRKIHATSKVFLFWDKIKLRNFSWSMDITLKQKY